MSIEFFYKVGNIICNVPWNKPTKSKLYELIEYFNNNFCKAHLFQISLHGGFLSSASNDTWDIDIKIHFVDIKYKNYQDIYDCFWFLYYYGLNKFHILVDIKYYDDISPITYILYNLLKNNQIDKYNLYLKSNVDCEIIDFTDTSEKKSINENWIIKKKKYKKIIEVNGGKLFIIDKKLESYNKFYNYVLNGRIYYKDIIINKACKINMDYFNN